MLDDKACRLQVLSHLEEYRVVKRRAEVGSGSTAPVWMEWADGNADHTFPGAS